MIGGNYSESEGGNDMDEFSFADWLTQELKNQHMTGVELSKRAMVSLHSIYKYTDGQRSPTILMANDILNALGKKFAVIDKGQPESYGCPVCRIQIDYGDKYCRHCGHELYWGK